MFNAEITFEENTSTEPLKGITTLEAAKCDALLTMTEILRAGFDGRARTVSARISDRDHHLVAAMSLTLVVLNG